MITRKKGILFIEKEIADFSKVAAELPENSEIEKLQKIGNDVSKTLFGILVTYKNPQNLPATINIWG